MRMIKCGWKNADDKMRMEKCGWQSADGKLPMTLCRWQNPYQWGKIKWRCFLKVLFVNKSSHLIVLILGREKSNILKNRKTRWRVERIWDSYTNKRRRRGFVQLSRILLAPRMFTWGYVNTEKVFYCSYKMILNMTTTSKAGESSGSGIARRMEFI